LEILVEHGLENYFADYAKPRNDVEWLRDWWEKNVWHSLTGLMDGVPVGCGYLTDIKTGDKATIGIFKKKGLLETPEVAEIFRKYLARFFEKFDLQKVQGFVRMDNDACKLIYQIIGFKEEGISKHHNKVRGKWQDYQIVSITKGEYYGRRQEA